MTDFTITEDFPRSEIEFDARFSISEACYQYLFQLKWPDGLVCIKCGHKRYWLSSRNLYICTQCGHQHSYQSPLSAETARSEWIAFVCRSPWAFPGIL